MIDIVTLKSLAQKLLSSFILPPQQELIDSIIIFFRGRLFTNLNLFRFESHNCESTSPSPLFLFEKKKSKMSTVDRNRKKLLPNYMMIPDLRQELHEKIAVECGETKITWNLCDGMYTTFTPYAEEWVRFTTIKVMQQCGMPKPANILKILSVSAVGMVPIVDPE